ncbi:AraC family transcriptional reguator [Sunxiuqinia dokdonensis]|uniref:AraC family transcriptional reguator n=1 Tax=Sunxiuqinia dokdonensis TaxID=1409788 RepID=A0A0L8V8L5_9BACT|nr:AraC family transcriptional reguator [Sunxiuqinia dokdonensis]
MVCNQCIMVVNQIFLEAGIQVKNVQLGNVETNDEVNDTTLKKN